MTALDIDAVRADDPWLVQRGASPIVRWVDPADVTSALRTADRLRRFATGHAMAARRGERLRSLVSGPPPDVVVHEPSHRNWLPEEAFDVPVPRFGAGRGTAQLVAAVHDATGQTASVVRPVGSIAYARRDLEVVWDLVRDVDLWCYVPHDVFRRQELNVLTDRVVGALRQRLSDAGLHCRSTLRRNLLLGEPGHRARMFELKLAPLPWLAAGLDVIGNRELTLWRPRTAAYAVAPRVEWAAYVGHENYYASPFAAAEFERIVASIQPADRYRGVEFTYRDNLAIAIGQFLPSRVHGSLRRRLFFARVRKALKIVLLLAVIRRDPILHAAAIDSLERLVPLDADVGGRRARLAYVAALTENLEGLRRVSPDVLMDAACPGGWS